MSYCSKCGKEVSEKSSFCQHCGANLSASASSGLQTPSTSAGLSQDDYAAFVGKNAGKYLTKFAKFSVGDGFKATWHWPAFFVPFWWMLYRKMYGWAILAFFLAVIPYVGLVTGVVWAIVANYIYYNHAKKKLLEIKQLHPVPETQQAVITVAGGVGNGALIIGVLISVVLVTAILAAIAIPQFSSYRMKAYNAAALTDLRNARNSCDSFYATNNRYPQTLEETEFIPSKNVNVSYGLVTADNYYIITAGHAQGSKVYRISSNSSEISERDSIYTGGPFTPVK